MPDQVPGVPLDGAVAAAVGPQVVAPPAPANPAGDNNLQNANNLVPAPQPAAREVSFRVCATSLVFASVYQVTVFESVSILFSRLGYKFSFRVCVQFYFPSVWQV